jgi:hypothetical protein
MNERFERGAHAKLRIIRAAADLLLGIFRAFYIALWTAPPLEYSALSTHITRESYRGVKARKLAGKKQDSQESSPTAPPVTPSGCCQLRKSVGFQAGNPPHARRRYRVPQSRYVSTVLSAP